MEEGKSDAPLYAVLRIDDLRLLVSQSEIQTLEPATDLQRGRVEGGGVALISHGGIQSTVYCPTKDLCHMDEIPPTRRVCAVFKNGGDQFGILCDEVQVRDQGLPSRLPLPICMQKPDSPIQELALLEGVVASVATAASLATFLGHDTSGQGND